jgi:hypothetical protein
MNRRCLQVTLAVTLASLSACSGDPAATPDADTADVQAVTDIGFDAGSPDVGIDAPDVPGVDVVVDNCDGGTLLDGGPCLRCAAGERVCGDRCTALTDPSTGCGAASCAPCIFANAMATCTAGACALGVCNAGFADCDVTASNGCEVETRTDVSNCGACGARCTVANATAACVGGACGVGTCNAGFGDCDGMAANGCETVITTALDHCGGCGVRCAPANATGACAVGSCSVASCNAGFGDCDGMAANGCEVNTRTDAANCNACGTRCAPANATGACAAGACTVGSCDAGFGDCDGDPSNGCEVNLRTDATHCGACPTRCTYANAAGVCRDAVCSLGTCTTGFDNCDGDAANGCEVETSSNPASCGVCFRVCSRDDATAACVSGACRIGRCDAGFSDCDGQDANGCEVNTGNSLAHCGACNRSCAPTNASGVCDEGRCNVDSCTPNFADCNESPGDGCEIDRRTNVNNCGACGNVCRVPHGTPSCVSGACGIASCDVGWGDCDGDLGNGCEINLLSTNADNCGVCGVFCSEVCRTGVCEQCTLSSAGATCRGGSICRCPGGVCACTD